MTDPLVDPQPEDPEDVLAASAPAHDDDREVDLDVDLEVLPDSAADD